MIKCGLCGKEFKDDQFEEYALHVNRCAANMSMKKKTEDMKKINEELEELKRAKVYYEGIRDEFKKKYPDIYKANFKDEVTEVKVNVGNTNDSVNTENTKKDINHNIFKRDLSEEEKDFIEFLSYLI